MEEEKTNGIRPAVIHHKRFLVEEQNLGNKEQTNLIEFLEMDSQIILFKPCILL